MPARIDVGPVDLFLVGRSHPQRGGGCDVVFVVFIPARLIAAIGNDMLQPFRGRALFLLSSGVVF